MNEKIKNFFCVIGGVIVGFFSTIIGCLLHNRGTTDGITKSIKSAKRTNRDTKDTVGRIGQSIDNSRQSVVQIGDTNRKLGKSVESSRNIFEEIKKQKLD